MLLVALVSLALGVTRGLAQDCSTIVKEAKAKYEKFQKEIQDMTIVQEIKMVTAKGETTSEVKMLRKGEKFRMETRMQMAETGAMPEGMETIVIYDGKDTWMISPFMGKMKLSGEQV